MMLTEWARAWAVSDTALADLRARMGVLGEPIATSTPAPRSEAAVQAAVRVEASRMGMRLFRNNVGAVVNPEGGGFIRYGLANDSANVNAVCKSADLIGIRPRIIQPLDVGHLIGQFVSIECKHESWRWANTERERAQGNWATLVASLGGDARFVTGERQL